MIRSGAGWLVGGGAGLLLAVAFFGGEAGRRWLWGLAPSALAPDWVWWAAAGVVGLGYSLCRWAARLPPVPPFWQAVAVFGGGSSAFYLLRLGHHLYGDGLLIVGLLEGPASGFALGHSNDLLLHRHLLGLARRLGNWSGPEVYVLTSCLGGGVYLLAGWSLVRAAVPAPANPPGRRVLGGMLFATGGFVQLFCGHIEHYALAVAAGGVTLACLARWNGRRSGWLAGAGGGLLVAWLLHPLSVYLLAPVGWAVCRQLWDRYGRGGLPWIGGLAFLVVGAAWWVVAIQPISPLDPGYRTQDYGLLGPAHRRDLLNMVLLLVAVPGLVLASLSLWWRAVDRRDAVLQCFVLAAGAGWGAVGGLDPYLGALDWDLIAVGLAPTATLAAYVAARYLPDKDLVGVGVGVAMGWGGLVLPWLGTNTGRASGVELIERMVAEDVHYRGRRNSVLAGRMLQSGAPEAAQRQYEAAVSWDPTEITALYHLGFMAYRAGRRQAAQGYFEAFLRQAPTHPEHRLVRGILAYMNGRWDEVALEIGYFLVDTPDHGGGQSIVAALQDELPQPHQRLVLEAAGHFAGGRLAAAAATAAELARRYDRDAEVQQFAAYLYGRLRLMQDRRGMGSGR